MLTWCVFFLFVFTEELAIVLRVSLDSEVYCVLRVLRLREVLRKT